MNTFRSVSHLVLGCALVFGLLSDACAGLTFSSGLGTTHVGNLVTNGSFELGSPPPGNGLGNAYAWSSGAPGVLPPGWTSPAGNASAMWGNDGPVAPYTLRFSDDLPDGKRGIDFHAGTGTIVNQPPTFQPNGQVTFPGTPTFFPVSGGPVVLSQQVDTHLTIAPSYNLSFWLSGEENSTNQGNIGAGLIGLRVTNVLPGNPIQWLAVPNGLFYGMSKLYEYQFTPINPLAPVDISFISWGGMDLTIHGGSPFGTQPILDDVIVNAVPEPSAATLLICGGLALAGVVIRRGRSRRIVA